ncbi:hypothetical protein AVEN_194872-1 [Araneus ventricosus]|uniref:Uncharacterized protein n=1 Tax=Araneus ventricosus TaxID=182803 RepID=A0A4Y2B582_ARAVE|nr:hypothetical protein AVEN_194872-1 [Araneus ventricosus]
MINIEIVQWTINDEDIRRVTAFFRKDISEAVLESIHYSSTDIAINRIDNSCNGSDCPSPSFQATPTGCVWLATSPIYGGSAVKLGFEPGALLLQSRGLTTRPPRPQLTNETHTYKTTRSRSGVARLI